MFKFDVYCKQAKVSSLPAHFASQAFISSLTLPLILQLAIQ